MRRFIPFLSMLSLALSTPTASPGPVVQLDYGSFQGTASGDLVSFLGMPFAAPPVGNLRFAPPQPPVAFSGIRQATSYGAPCLLQSGGSVDFLGTNISTAMPTNTTSEDCLFINVLKPATIANGTKLPVIFWLFGGGFQFGDASQNTGDTVVERSIALSEPVIWVAPNYRVSALGFLGGKEVKAAGIGNAGLRDQRFALQWVHQNIEKFGGDPTKVTMWGGSAGSISVGLQLFANNGDPAGLFRGAVMSSGFPLHLQDITGLQPYFDQLVQNTGCTGSADPISCLRSVSTDTMQTAINLSPNIFSYTSLKLAWAPSVDGDFLSRDPQLSIKQGVYAKVPIITGDCDDEGTAFSFTTTNITTNAQFLDYIQNNYFKGVPADRIAALGAAYPDDITQGSPFDTGLFNAITPEFKRIAAIQTDNLFHAPRRFFLQAAAKTQPVFAYLFKRGKPTPFLGSAHGSDIPELFGTGLLPNYIATDALVNFVNTQDPNNPSHLNSLLSLVHWPQWGSSVTSPPLLTFIDPSPLVSITADTFRASSIALLINISMIAEGGTL